MKQVATSRLGVFRACISGLLACVALAGEAAEGDGSLRIEYQYIRTGAFDSSIGEIDIGHTDAHVIMLSGSYAFTDRLTAYASLPWIKKRHTGALPHNAVLDFQNYEPPDLRVIDDGNYHSDWQDLFVGLQYLVRDERLKLAPFISYGLPTEDYPFYGHSAVGRNLWHIPVGLNWAYEPYFDKWYLDGSVAYVFTEKTLGVDVSHWLADLSLGYYLTDRFAPRLFVTTKYGTQGLDFPDDFDLDNLDSADWYYHDRTIKHNWVNAGVGFDWILNDSYQLTGSWFTMVDPDQVNIVDRAWTLAISWYFGRHDDPER